MNSAAILTLPNTDTIKLHKGETHYTDLCDEDLVLASQRGDNRALKHLLRRHKHLMLSIIYRLASDFTDPSDMFQEASIRVWRSIGQLRNPSALKSWLNQIITRLYYDELRKRQRQIHLISLEAPRSTQLDITISNTLDIADRSPRPDEKAVTEELAGVLSIAISRIPVNFRTAVILRDIEGKTYQEIAAMTHSEIGTVKSRIARARRKVQSLLTSYMKNAA